VRAASALLLAGLLDAAAASGTVGGMAAAPRVAAQLEELLLVLVPDERGLLADIEGALAGVVAVTRRREV
jgi:hypothetical protein